MSTKWWVMIIVILAVIIAVLAWLLFTTPVAAPPSTSTQASSTQTTTSGSPAPTSTTTNSIQVTSPLPNATVSHTFSVTGVAPNGWFFEAVFPVQVRDPDDNLVGSTQARAQSDWTVPGPIAFTAQVTVDASYSGPASLILLKDNPSGLPQNADEITVTITVR